MRSQIAVAYSLIFCYCTVVSSANIYPPREDSDKKWEGANEPGKRNLSPLPDAHVHPTRSSQDTRDIRGHPRYPRNVESGDDKQSRTTGHLDTKIMELKNTTISEISKMEEKLSEYQGTPPADCWDILQNGYNSSGVYKIQPSGTTYSFDVYCDMETRGGGWTVFQNRNNRQVNFTRTWQEYKLGFGDLHGNFWLGLENVYQMTSRKLYEILIELKYSESTQFFALYDKFVIQSEIDGYLIKELGEYNGTLGEYMGFSDGKKFSTMDVNNEKKRYGIYAVAFGGGWWYGHCANCNLNSAFLGPDLSEDEIKMSFYWINDEKYYPMLETRMSIRPRDRLH